MTCCLRMIRTQEAAVSDEQLVTKRSSVPKLALNGRRQDAFQISRRISCIIRFSRRTALKAKLSPHIATPASAQIARFETTSPTGSTCLDHNFLYRIAAALDSMAAAAAAAASKYTGKYALHPLLPGAAQAVADACSGKLHPSWTEKAQTLLTTWEKLHVCMPRYANFMAKCNRKDLKRPHVFMNEQAQAALGEFYLCCALRLRADEVDAAGEDMLHLSVWIHHGYIYNILK
eukprot:s1274_g21.t1